MLWWLWGILSLSVMFIWSLYLYVHSYPNSLLKIMAAAHASGFNKIAVIHFDKPVISCYVFKSQFQLCQLMTKTLCFTANNHCHSRYIVETFLLQKSWPCGKTDNWLPTLKMAYFHTKCAVAIVRHNRNSRKTMARTQM